MTHSHRLRLIIPLAALLWALLLACTGLWALGAHQTFYSLHPATVPSLGLALLGAAQFIYMSLFADRLFPRAHPLLVNLGEITSFLTFIAGLGAAAWFFAQG